MDLVSEGIVFPVTHKNECNGAAPLTMTTLSDKSLSPDPDKNEPTDRP